ncbi:MAG: glycosyltransferase [Butyrivibrio sp.]|nr:glycosyltransferase [Butyrivibrio sp.]MBQ8031824.1 glycosyltransferase [Butyrivibrio sp.]MBR1640765.1 glycosyltransferase [Butyrivibrio sp.]
MAKISVIIPVYNTAQYMDQCIESVLAQTMTDIEIMLVDDGSTDGVSGKKCDEFAAKDSRVKVIHKENGGLQSAWIAGTVEATSNYVSYVDSDDWIDADMMEGLYALTSVAQEEAGQAGEASARDIGYKNPFIDCEIVAGNYIVEKTGERRKETQALQPGVYTGAELDKIRRRLLGEEVRPVTMSRCMKLISRKLVLENIKYCDPTIFMSEDVNITLPCLCDVKRLAIAKDSYFYHYRLVGSSMAHSYKPNFLKDLELSNKTFRGILEDKGIENADQQMDREFVMILLLVMKNELRCPDKDTAARVKGIFLREDIRSKVAGTDVTISGLANRLLYFTMKHPAAPVVGCMKMILGAYDKKTN